MREEAVVCRVRQLPVCLPVQCVCLSVYIFNYLSSLYIPSQQEENTKLLVKLNNKRDLMTKILRESEEKRKEREEMMDIHRAYIDSLPNPGKFIFSLLPQGPVTDSFPSIRE